MISFQL